VPSTYVDRKCKHILFLWVSGLFGNFTCVHTTLYTKTKNSLVQEFELKNSCVRYFYTKNRSVKHVYHFPLNVSDVSLKVNRKGHRLLINKGNFIQT
jgi:hypothetical protein